MITEIKGLHHVTSMARDAAENNHFFSKTLGLRRVKQTVNFDEPSVYHLYYGDEAGSRRYGDDALSRSRTSPAAGRAPARSAPRCFPCRRARSALGRSARCRTALVISSASESFGEKRLSFRAPEGDALALVEVADDARAVDRQWRWCRRMRSAASTRRRCALRDGGATEELLKFMGYENADSADGIKRLVRPGGNGADLDRYRSAARRRPRRSRRRLGAPHRLRGRKPGGAAGGAQGAARYRLPGDAGDRPRLFLGDLLPHAGRRAVRGRDQRAGLRPRRGHRASRRSAEAAAAARASAGAARQTLQPLEEKERA